MRVLICCPLGRPQNRDRVLEMFRRQTLSSALRLVCKDDAPTIGEARNWGLRFARDTRIEWVVQWDDDNYYGPRYVERIMETVSLMPDLDVVSMGLGFVRDGSELWHFPKGVGFYPGHSTAVRVAAAHQFEHVSLGEDVRWSEVAAARGLRGAFVEPWGLVYDRTGDDHAYDADRTEFLRSFGPTVPLGRQPDSFVDTPHELPKGPLVSAKDDAVFGMLERKLRLVAGRR